MLSAAGGTPRQRVSGRSQRHLFLTKATLRSLTRRPAAPSQPPLPLRPPREADTAADSGTSLARFFPRCSLFAFHRHWSRTAGRRRPRRPYRHPAPGDSTRQPRRGSRRLLEEETTTGCEKENLRSLWKYWNDSPGGQPRAVAPREAGEADLVRLYSFAVSASVPFNLWSRYSRMTLMTWTMARMREPKASEPVWYLGKIAPVRRGQPQGAHKCSSRGTYRSARPKAEKRGKAGMSSGFLKAQ